MQSLFVATHRLNVRQKHSITTRSKNYQLTKKQVNTNNWTDGKAHDNIDENDKVQSTSESLQEFETSIILHATDLSKCKNQLPGLCLISY